MIEEEGAALEAPHGLAIAGQENCPRSAVKDQRTLRRFSFYRRDASAMGLDQKSARRTSIAQRRRFMRF